MSASDHLQPAQFYHGSQYRIDPGDTVRTTALIEKFGPSSGRTRWNYFTTKKDVAEDYASHPDAPGYIHAVEPTGSYERDPVDPPGYEAYRSSHPLKVLSVEEIPGWRR